MKIKAVLTIVLLNLITITANSQNAEEIFQKGNSLYSEGKYKQALIYVDSSLNIDSSLYQRFGFRADIKVSLGMVESAIDDITKCIQKCDCPTRKFHVASYYLDRAELHLKNDNETEWINDVNQSIIVNPDNWESYYYRSLIFIKAGKYNEALTDLNKSILNDDNQAYTIITRGNLRIKMGDLEGACNDLTQAVNWGFDEYEPWIKENCKK